LAKKSRMFVWLKVKIAGVASGENIEGMSILPVLTQPAQTLPDRDLFWVRREGGNRYRGQDYHAMRRGPWKLVQNHPFEPYQLYNLQTDPGETMDVIGHENKIAQPMIQALQAQLQKAGRVAWQKGR